METKQETKPFPAGSLGGLLANRMRQGYERDNANGNEPADFGLTKASGRHLIYKTDAHCDMALTKRQRRELEEGEARLIQFQEKYPPPRPEVQPFTKEEKGRYDRIEQLLQGIQFGNTDPSEMQELLSLTCFLGGSRRLAWVRQKFPHYLMLKQVAAKRTLWQKMCQELSGVQTEVSRSRSAREQGGVQVQ